jgi:hypothetical protein
MRFQFLPFVGPEIFIRLTTREPILIHLTNDRAQLFHLEWGMRAKGWPGMVVVLWPKSMHRPRIGSTLLHSKVPHIDLSRSNHKYRKQNNGGFHDFAANRL